MKKLLKNPLLAVLFTFLVAMTFWSCSNFMDGSGGRIVLALPGANSRESAEAAATGSGSGGGEYIFNITLKGPVTVPKKGESNKVVVIDNLPVGEYKVYVEALKKESPNYFYADGEETAVVEQGKTSKVKIQLQKRCLAPVITRQPVESLVINKNQATSLSIEASVNQEGQLLYWWQKVSNPFSVEILSSINDYFSGVGTFSVPADISGTYYYVCWVAHVYENLQPAFTRSRVVTVVVQDGTEAPTPSANTVEVSSWEDLNTAIGNGSDSICIALNDSNITAGSTIQIKRPVTIVAKKTCSVVRGGSFNGAFFQVMAGGSLIL